MTRYFRSIAALLLAGHLLVLWMAVLTEPRTFYWHVMSLTAHPQEIAWAALAVTLWLLVDSLLVCRFPGYCRIGDRLRFYPLAAALVVQGIVMFAGREHPIIWIDWGKDMLLTLFLMFSDALYNRRKYGRGHGDEPEGDAHAEH